MDKKELKKILKEQREDFKRYMGVLIEHSDKNTSLLAESLVGVQGQLTVVREMVAKNTEDIEVMKMDLHIIKDDLKEKVDRSEFRVLEKRVARLEKTSHNK